RGLAMRLLLGLLLLCVPMSAHAADWWEAETAHFIVLSESSEREAAELAVKLERFDESLRFLQNMAPEEEPLPRWAKLTLYHFGSTEDIGYLLAGKPSSVAGFFIPRAGNSVAFVPRRNASLRERSTSILKPDEFSS